jgi:hypothetical protein
MAEMIEETSGYASGKQFSQEVIETLQAQEIDLDDQQTFALYLYVPTEAQALECQTKIEAQGYECDVEESAAENGNWLCYITTPSIFPTELTLEPLGTLLIELAALTGGDFDGWEIKQDFALNIASLMDFSEVAQNVLTSIRANFVAKHEFVEADLEDFDDLDHGFYDAVQRGFAGLGYKKLSDKEDKTIGAQGIRTLIRTLYHPELNSVAVAYFVPAMDAGIFEIETLLSNGKVVVSTIAPEGIEIANWPLIESKHFSPETKFSELHAFHQQHCAEVLIGIAEATRVPVTTFEENVAMQNHMNQHKHDYLKEIGWVTKQYLLTQANGDEVTAVGVFEAIQEIVKAEAAGA